MKDVLGDERRGPGNLHDLVTDRSLALGGFRPKRSCTVPTAGRMDVHELIHVAGREGLARGALVSGLAATLAAGGFGRTSRRRCGRILGRRFRGVA